MSPPINTQPFILTFLVGIIAGIILPFTFLPLTLLEFSGVAPSPDRGVIYQSACDSPVYNSNFLYHLNICLSSN